MGTGKTPQDPIVLVIDFHHARGPEIELCFCKEGDDPVGKNDWSLLPFMALSDGAHTSTEDFSYFTITQNPTSGSEHARSLFGISCSRQIDSASLINRPPEVTRSTVQKAVVVIIDEPKHFGQLRERLSMVTSAWFAQRDFSDTDILKKFQESLAASLNNVEGEDKNLGLSLREMIHEFKYQTLVLFKCLLLQPKMLFFGSRCERLCMIQFSLISLIPGLINNLEDCADPSFDNYATTVEKPTSLKTSERSSLLSYMGLPLQIFGKGSMFGPYTPLQHLDLLADYGTKSYVVGSTNSLLLQQKDRYSDILINLDEGTINISSPSLRNALSLSAADRRWIDFLTQTINDTWDEAHPERPKAHGYVGSEEFIRLQFEEYLLALLSCVKYHDTVAPQSTGDVQAQQKSPGVQTLDIEGDPALEFNPDFLDRWRTTSNYALFNRLTSDAMLFSIVEPRHPCAGGLNIEDVQRRIAQQVAELHLDERVKEGREVLNKHFATGQKKVTAAFNNFWADIEAMREAQRKRNEGKAQHAADGRSSMDKETATSPGSPRASVSSTQSPAAGSWSIAGRKPPQVDLAQAQASVAAAGQRASAYFSSWSSWANDRRKEWQEKKNATPSNTASSPRQSTGTDAPERSNSRRGREPRPSLAHSEEASNVSRSASRRKRWSSVFKRSDSSGPSRAEAESSPRGLTHTESDNSKSDESAVMVAHAQEYALDDEQSMPRISTTEPPEEEEHDRFVHEQRRPSAPTPTLVPSDRLRVSSLSENASISPISPLRLDMTGEGEGFFQNVDLSSAPDQGAELDGNKTTDPSSQSVGDLDTPSKPAPDAEK